MKNRDVEDAELERRLNRFADLAEADSPLYGLLARVAATDPVCHQIMLEIDRSQPAANVLLAAVQYLLLEGRGADLAAHYPALETGAEPTGDPAQLFLEFCREHQGRLTELAAVGRVQTNEVRRCALLVPAFIGADGGRPLAIIEVGPSVGLNLSMDRYRYDYGRAVTGDLDSPLTLTSEVRGGKPPVDRPLPEIAWRRGVDMNRIDLDDEKAMRWARSLLWPEQRERVDRFEKALSLTRDDPPQIVEGNALDLLPDLIGRAPVDLELMVFHSFVVNQFTEDERERLDGLLRSASHRRPITRIAVEMLFQTMDFPTITMTAYDGGVGEPIHLGNGHHHGAWLDWVA